MTAVAHFRKGWLTLYLAVALVIVVFGVWLAVETAPRSFEEALVASHERTAGVLIAALGALVGTLALGVLARRGPALAFDDDGLLVAAFAWSSPCRVDWDQLAAVTVRPDLVGLHPLRLRERHLSIDLRDPEGFLDGAGQTGALLRWTMRNRLRNGDPPLAYPESLLREPLEEVARVLNDELRRRA